MRTGTALRGLRFGATAALLGAALCGCGGARARAPVATPLPPGRGASASEAHLVSDTPAPRPVPPPPGSPDALPPVPGAGEGKSLDELLAVVEGDVITRRRIAKMIGERAPDEDERQYEEKVYRALLLRARTSVIVKAATRMGLTAPPDMLDAFVVKRSKAEVEAARAKAEEARPGSGATITFERMLAERGQTMEDYRAERADEMLIGNYFHVLANGVPGKRPMLDFEASPGDIRRLYDAHRSKFDVQHGVRFAFWIAKPTDFFGKEDITYDQAKALAQRALDAAVADYRSGVSAEEAKDRHGLAAFNEFPPGKWAERGQFSKKAGPEIEEWLFDPARKAGDSKSFALDDPLAIVVIETRPARTRTFDEVEAEVAALIREVRESRFRLTHTLELLGRATVQSRANVLEDLQASARADLRRLDDDPVWREIRLR